MPKKPARLEFGSRPHYYRGGDMSSELDRAVERLTNEVRLYPHRDDGVGELLADVRLVLAALARKHAALVWARKYATGFDHLIDCQHMTPTHCNCGYKDFNDSLDGAIAATDALAATEDR